MLNLKATLKNRLKGAKRIALLSVGSELRGDDAAGILVGEEFKKSCKNLDKGNCRIFFGGSAPENFTGRIKQFKPTHLIIVDSADLRKKPGTIAIIDPKDVGGFSFGTHQLPLKMMVDYMSQSLNCKAFIIGIQPKNTGFGSSHSEEVAKSVRVIIDSLKAVL